jgi:SPP1 family predicted phage head-tail adaptor
MRAGKLRHKLLIQTGALSPDGTTGENSKNWTTTWTAYGSVRAVTGGETWLANTTHTDLTHVINLRGSQSVNITQSMRILFGTRVFEILDPNNMSEIDKEWQIQVKEVPEGGLDA